MCTISPNQFSVKVKVPQGVLYKKSDRLSEVFKDTLEGYLGKGKFRVTARCYMVSLQCRFTVIFAYIPSHPDNIKSLVEKVAKRTITTVITEKSNGLQKTIHPEGLDKMP